MEDLKELMRHHFLSYASYVILERALPRLEDGLKPVQRRLLQTLFLMHDGKFHKVANVVGQTMALHPHGDAPIYEALVHLANKGFLCEMQGNFGNLLTGDPAAAARYIEVRLSPLALETLFHPSLTAMVPSYDGRQREPVVLPAKIPLLLLQGAEGIAVGMSTKILPHNFSEVLKAEIAEIEGRPYTLLPDFPTGGFLDASLYEGGKGTVTLRARISTPDPKTILIQEICYGTTTESVINSIEEAAKKGKIKIETIADYTAERVEIEIKLPRGCYARECIDALYAFTECEVTLHPQMICIHGEMPALFDVHAMVRFYAEKLRHYLKAELEETKEGLLQKLFEKSLEQLFIEKRLFLLLEEQESEEEAYAAVSHALYPFHDKLQRIPERNDLEKLFAIPIRRISRFDGHKNREQILSLHKEVAEIEQSLGDIDGHAVNYLKELLKRHGKKHLRRTTLTTFHRIDRKAMEKHSLEVYYDQKSGFLGTKIDRGKRIECTNLDKLLCLLSDGSYLVLTPEEKYYLHPETLRVVYLGAVDRKKVFNVIYRDPTTQLAYAKRFGIAHYILNKSYRFFEEGMELLHLEEEKPEEEPREFQVFLVPKVKQRVGEVRFSFREIVVKGVSAKGIRISSRPVQSLTPHSG